MNILALTSSQMPFGSNPTDGAGYRTWILLKRIARQSNVYILSLYEDMYKKQLAHEIEEDHLKIASVRCDRRAISQRVDEIQPDIIYLASWSLYIFLPRIEVPLAVDLIGPSLLENIYLGRYPQTVAARVKAEAFSNASLIMCSNERLKHYLIGFLTSRGIDKNPESIMVVPVGLPTEPPKRNENLGAKFQGENVILVAGSLNPWYDYETLFKAAKELTEANLRILFMGDDPTTVKIDVKRRILDLAEKYGFQDRTTITGLVPFKDRINFYAQADIGLNLGIDSWEDELSSRARIVDYLWAGMRIITSGRDVLSKQLVDSDCASYFRSGDYKALSKLIREVLYEKRGLEPGDKGRAEVLKTLDLEQYVPQLMESFETLTKMKHSTTQSIFSQMSYCLFKLRRLGLGK